MNMTRRNYKSDFDFVVRLTDCADKNLTVPWPDCDWEMLFFTSSKANTYAASRKNGVYTNCFAEADGGMHFVLDNHRLAPGVLHMQLHVRLPNGIYPDGVQNLYRPQPLGIELVTDAGDCPTAAETEAVVPYAVVTAYETARAAGFAGTEAEYYAGLEALPALSAAVSDFAAGKAAVARELRAKGADVPDDAAMADMAGAVHSLRLAVEGEPGIVSQHWRGIGTDLLNALRNHQHPDYPYCWAAATPQQEVPLAGADAYLCSDGYFTTEQGTVHTFADSARENWVIYYNRDRRYTVANTIGYVTGICVLSGTPSYSLADRTGYTTVGPVHSYTGDLPPDGEVTDINLDAPGITSIYLRGVRRVTGAGHICDKVAVLAGAVALPDLEEIDANNTRFLCSANTRAINLPKLSRTANTSILHDMRGITQLVLPALAYTLRTNVAYYCARLQSASLPKLAEHTGGGTLFYQCAALEEVDLPRLRKIASYQCGICNLCDKVQSITLPALEQMGVGAIVTDSSGIRRIDLPRLRDYGMTRGDHGVLWNCNINHDVDIYMPAVERSVDIDTGRPRQTYLVCGITGTGGVHLRLGTQQDADLNIVAAYISGSTRNMSHLHVAPGFRSSLPVAYTYAGTTRDELLDLIANLADNTAHPTHAIGLGAELLELLAEDEIALATAKNYTLS